MIILDRMFAGGLRFVLQRVADAAASELDNPESLKEELLAAQMQLELGEIDEAEFERIEAAILARMRELRGEAPGAISMTDDRASVDIDAPDDM